MEVVGERVSFGGFELDGRYFDVRLFVCVFVRRTDLAMVVRRDGYLGLEFILSWGYMFRRRWLVCFDGFIGRGS